MLPRSFASSAFCLCKSRSFPPPIALHRLRFYFIASAQLRHSPLASLAPSLDRATALGLSCVHSLGFRADRFLRALLPRRRFHSSRASGLYGDPLKRGPLLCGRVARARDAATAHSVGRCLRPQRRRRHGRIQQSACVCCPLLERKSLFTA